METALPTCCPNKNYTSQDTIFLSQLGKTETMLNIVKIISSHFKGGRVLEDFVVHLRLRSAM